MYSNPPDLVDDLEPPATSEDKLAARVRDAVKLAVDQFNEANPECTVALDTPDTTHQDKVAQQVAEKIVTDRTVLGSVIASYSSEVNRIGPVYDKAGLGFLVPLAKAPGLNQGNHWPTYNRITGDDQMAGRSMPKYLLDDLHAERVMVIGDGQGHSPGINKQAVAALGDQSVGELVVPRETTDFSDVNDQIAAKKPDAVFFSGDPRFGGTLLTAIRKGGYTGAVLFNQSLMEPRFTITAGDDAEGVSYGCTCSPPDGNPEMTGGPEFRDAYVKAYGVEPTDYAPEAFDATVVLLKGLEAGVHDRSGMADFIRNYSGPGITKDISFGDDGDITGDPYFIYTIKDGKPQFTAFVR
jgi:branched-chain amino acid transport system substrate-binding protein